MQWYWNENKAIWLDLASVSRRVLLQVHRVQASCGANLTVKKNWRRTGTYPSDITTTVVVLHVPCGYNGSYPARYPLGLLLMFFCLRLRYCHIESQHGKDIIRQSPAGLSMQRLRWSRVNIKGNHFESRCMSCSMNTTCTRLLFSSFLRWNCLHSHLKMRTNVRRRGLDREGWRRQYCRPLGGRCGMFEKETINTE